MYTTRLAISGGAAHGLQGSVYHKIRIAAGYYCKFAQRSSLIGLRRRPPDAPIESNEFTGTCAYVVVQFANDAPRRLLSVGSEPMVIVGRIQDKETEFICVARSQACH